MRSWGIVLLLLYLFNQTAAQPNRFFFRKLTVANGLNDGSILAIAQDSRGFMWFSTKAGLNRFDGKSVKTYSFTPGDPASLPTSLSRCMSADSSGGFLIGLGDGMLEYDTAGDCFIPVKALADTWVTAIVPFNKNTVYLGTGKGLGTYNPVTKTVSFFNRQKDSLSPKSIYQIGRSGIYAYIVGNTGVIRLNSTTGQLEKIHFPLPGTARITAVAIDGSRNYWLATRNPNRLLKFSADCTTRTDYSQYIESGNNTITNFSAMIADRNGRIWVATQLNGLLLYNPQTDLFDPLLHNPLQAWTPSTNLHSTLYCDSDGRMWVGGNNGINYFNPDKTFFHILPVFNKDPDTRNRRVARVAVEDKNGRIWMGTIDGLVRYDPKTEQYKEWNNRDGRPPAIHFNSIRGILCDADNNIWIATGHGINQYRQDKGKMIFYTAKDSIPEIFYFSADKDRNGNLWFSSRDEDGFYYYNPQNKKFHSIRSVPGLNLFAGEGGRKLFQDSKGRYWLGFNGSGLGMYDPATEKHRRWKASAEPGSIAGNAVVDIKEDQMGTIWVSTFTGLSVIDPITFRVTNYNHTNGLINNSVGPLAIDEKNRVWIGTSGGLMLLDSSHTYFTAFGLQQGLPSVDFPEHAASILNNGEILMPTQNGFIRFAAAGFKKENRPLTPFFTTFDISGNRQEQQLNNPILLKQDENFFTIGFAAVNYDNPEGTWYAYRLDGIDEDWKYTRNRFADYTKIPGGNYTFRLKASTDRDQWEQPEQLLRIHIDTPFYKAGWFRPLLLLLLIAAIVAFYRYRIRQREKLLALQGKAQLLKKEKAMVMYESLKQQLNPHFLFNSLTSLSGLIDTDRKTANSFLEQMSRIYRYILKNRDSELVTLREELAFVQTYVQLQKTRFKEGLQVTVAVAEEDYSRRIAPVTLQNLTENAIKHNIIDQDAPLCITFSTENGYLVVKNNLQKKHVVETSNKQGLASLQALYAYLSNKPLIIDESAKTFCIYIPLI
ncbi:ligand-binding sensor domain-containing protein [Niabella drilacis]|nr:two-component regulator propeller domain-containing protein [Niabella drilacis]